MAQQGEGWPLGLQPLNVRVGVPGNRDCLGSVSFNTLMTASPVSFTDSSTDLDTESTGSFFHDNTITLGSLIGVSNILELSRRSIRGRRTESTNGKRSNARSRTWLFFLCSRESTDVDSIDNSPSLGHFLAEERRAAVENRRNQGLELELELAESAPEPNSLFINGCVAPPQCSLDSDAESGRNGGTEPANDSRVALLCACICGH
ncbi:uncharacterized protein At3g17950-like [Cucurbita pepo subsp. pepo]|uniref:uncharacterized protein At3g17950-like n=1 Tax=Cucurbita pepo subsp. pepo TaxID=3664 RepID=UPI000C9D5327|nr:uncharacterized protein At3g17950-like [Cucurbita pepo subsp. pepo]